MITGINHVTFAVHDLDESFDFYREVLGFRPVARWSEGAYLLAGEAWIALQLDSDTRQSPLPEYSHVAFSVSEETFESTCEKIRGAGARIWRENDGHGPSLYFEDPNGHKLEVHASDLESRVKIAGERQWEGIELFE
jgi:catechol 2,3-dioxygenase-like lactoylglutathione lyase family enzyme